MWAVVVPVLIVQVVRVCPGGPRVRGLALLGSCLVMRSGQDANLALQGIQYPNIMMIMWQTSMVSHVG